MKHLKIKFLTLLTVAVTVLAFVFTACEKEPEEIILATQSPYIGTWVNEYGDASLSFMENGTAHQKLGNILSDSLRLERIFSYEFLNDSTIQFTTTQIPSQYEQIGIGRSYLCGYKLSGNNDALLISANANFYGYIMAVNWELNYYKIDTL